MASDCCAADHKKQPPAVGYRLLAVSYQLSAVSYPLIKIY